MRNTQIPIKQDMSTPNLLAVNSIFYTIQGEGPFAGSPSVFVRLMGCNLQCPDCDTEYTTGSHMFIPAIVQEVTGNWIVGRGYKPRPLVVITGGEPFRQNISKLVWELLAVGFHVQIETNGTLFVDLGWAFAHKHLTIVCSPKAGKVNKDLQRHIKAYKYVLDCRSVSPLDGLPRLALSHSASPEVARPHEGFKGDVYIQPVDTPENLLNPEHLKAAVHSSMTYGYRLCLQLHKMIGVP